MTEGRFGVTQTCVNGIVPAVTYRCKQMSRRRVRRPRRTVLCFRLCKRDVEDAVPYNHNLKHPYKLQFDFICKQLSRCRGGVPSPPVPLSLSCCICNISVMLFVQNASCGGKKHNQLDKNATKRKLICNINLKNRQVA